ncbi:hypothetical protein [Dokdonia sp.]|uniref:hypothetical protein n=1 Tax=Dokdonia sp. TaxID=2024995 RepID=UPI0032670D57
MIPIWLLYNTESLEDITYDEVLSETLKDGYDLDSRKLIYKVLEWAESKTEYDYNGIMDNAPTSRKLDYSNSEIYQFLMDFKNFMEKSEYGLLSDNRPSREL